MRTPALTPPARLLLVGGGHAHVEVLRRLRARPAGLAVTLASPGSATPYSGMLPGFVAGHYRADEMLIPLEPLCRAAGAARVAAEVARLDLRAGAAGLDDGRTLPFDLLSLDCGARPMLAGIDGAATLGVPVKPLADFVGRWQALVERWRGAPRAPRRLVIVGGGAGGVELALAAAHRLRRVEGLERLALALVTADEELVPAQPAGARRRLERCLAGAGVTVHRGRAVRAARPGALTLAGDVELPADEVLWATQAAAQPWLAASGLGVDAGGFVRVGPTLQSVSDPRVFAAGDTAEFEPAPLPKAGVYAVRQGPVLAENLLRALRGAPLVAYRPQRRFLTLISTGSRSAVAARGGLWAAGRWAWRLKDRIDRRFVARYRADA